MSGRVFISYKRQDPETKLVFDALCTHLESAGLQPVWDAHDLRTGLDWRRQLRRLMDSCEAAVLLIAPATLNSPHCRREAEQLLLRAQQVRDRHREGEDVRLPFVLRTVKIGVRTTDLRDFVPDLDRDHAHTADPGVPADTVAWAITQDLCRHIAPPDATRAYWSKVERLVAQSTTEDLRLALDLADDRPRAGLTVERRAAALLLHAPDLDTWLRRLEDICPQPSADLHFTTLAELTLPYAWISADEADAAWSQWNTHRHVAFEACDLDTLAFTTEQVQLRHHPRPRDLAVHRVSAIYGEDATADLRDNLQQSLIAKHVRIRRGRTPQQLVHTALETRAKRQAHDTVVWMASPALDVQAVLAEWPTLWCADGHPSAGPDTTVQPAKILPPRADRSSAAYDMAASFSLLSPPSLGRA